MKKYLWFVIPGIILMLVIGYYFYYQQSLHDYSTCIKAGGKAEQSNEHFSCQINGKFYWNQPPTGAVE